MGNEFLLGKRLSPEELGRIVGLNPRTVKKHFQRFGGQKIGSRYIFFEALVADALAKGAELNEAEPEPKREDRAEIPEETHPRRFGVETKADIHRRLEKNDRHGLFGGLKRG